MSHYIIISFRLKVVNAKNVLPSVFLDKFVVCVLVRVLFAAHENHVLQKMRQSRQLICWEVEMANL